MGGLDGDQVRDAPAALSRARVARSRLHPATLAAIAVGGAAGTCARVGIAEALPTAPGGFPWATFAVNASGSLLLGFVMVLVLDRLAPTRLVRPLLATGVCGAYTTFSTLVTDVDLQIRAGELGLAATYLVANLLAGIAAVLFGMMLARAMPGREGATWQHRRPRRYS